MGCHLHQRCHFSQFLHRRMSPRAHQRESIKPHWGAGMTYREVILENVCGAGARERAAPAQRGAPSGSRAPGLESHQRQPSGQDTDSTAAVPAAPAPKRRPAALPSSKPKRRLLEPVSLDAAGRGTGSETSSLLVPPTCCHLLLPTQGEAGLPLTPLPLQAVKVSDMQHASMMPTSSDAKAEHSPCPLELLVANQLRANTLPVSL